LPRSRKKLAELEAQNVTGFDFDHAKKAKAEREAEKERQRNRLTIKTRLPLCRKLEEMTKGRADRPWADNTVAGDEIRHRHLTRLLGNVHLDLLCVVTSGKS